MTAPNGARASIPNALTAARVVLAAALFVLLSLWSYADSPARATAPNPTVDHTLLAAVALFILAALTDALDGYLARRWHAVSAFGRIMDPFADKLLIIGTFAFLAGPAFLPPPLSSISPEPVSAVYPWMVAIILARELLVTSIRAEAESRGVPFPADWSGKLKMILQSVCIPAVLLTIALGAAESPPGRTLIRTLTWTTVLITAWSTIPYTLRGWRALASSRPR